MPRPPRPVYEAPTDLHPQSLERPGEKRGRFFNRWAPMPDHSLGLLRWQLSANPYRAARKRPLDVPRADNDGGYLHRPGEAPSVTWIGHSTVLVHDGGDLWLTDPIFSPSIFVLRRHHPAAIPLDRMPAPKFVVVSHDHYDHLDLPSLRALPPETVVAAPRRLAGYIRRRARRAHTLELDWWQSGTVGDWTLTLLPAQHWCRRGLTQDRVLWGSWLVEGHGRSYYFAGDTGYFHGFREIGRRHGPIDVAFLPIGAYEPRWFMRYQHMDPAQAVTAFEELGARRMLPIHWGTFDLTDEPIDEAPRELARVLEGRPDLAARVHLLPIGGRLPVEAAGDTAP